MFPPNFQSRKERICGAVFNGILVDATKWRSSVRNVAILFPKPR